MPHAAEEDTLPHDFNKVFQYYLKKFLNFLFQTFDDWLVDLFVLFNPTPKMANGEKIEPWIKSLTKKQAIFTLKYLVKRNYRTYEEIVDYANAFEVRTSRINRLIKRARRNFAKFYSLYLDYSKQN